MERERRGFIEVLGGRGMPLAELGLLLVPPLTEDEIKARYADAIELGKARTHGTLVEKIWDIAIAKGNTTLLIYLTKVALGWSEKGPGEQDPLKQNPDNPAPSARAAMPSLKELEAAGVIPLRKAT